MKYGSELKLVSKELNHFGHYQNENYAELSSCEYGNFILALDFIVTKINHVGFQFEMYTIHIMNYESSDERAIVMYIVLR